MPRVYTHHVLRQRVLAAAGVFDRPPLKTAAEMIELLSTQWSVEFEQLMRRRLAMGALRYGGLGDKRKPQYDRVGSAISRLRRYAATGNLELLADAANMCLVEYVEGRHPNRHFNASDDGEHAAAVKH